MFRATMCPSSGAWRLCAVIASCWYVPWLQEGGQFRLEFTFCILHFSSNSFSTCFGQPCAHHQELTTAWCYSLVLVCTVAAGRLSRPARIHFCILYFSSNSCSTCFGQPCANPSIGRTNYQPHLTTFLQPRHKPTQSYNITQSSAPDDGHTVARNMLSSYYKRNKE